MLPPACSGDTWTADLQYAPGKMIRAEGNVPYDESLLQASVTTPFSGYSTMSLTFTMDQRAYNAPTEFHVRRALGSHINVAQQM